ncbi:hypothetical protein [Nitrosomonas oligotropha]|uniref:hypothetical protein n=1 Tax=Nitrosomonas oligotropha TaxID=42354 RepID=UPI00136FB7BA|nr:hypothetical protein [Nitrosomonas oligotropha]MXS82280.1 hypothetical protein [Nitrosomonas oligotropha]
MSITVPSFTNLPNAATQTESQYNLAWGDTLGTFNLYGAALNALGAQVEEDAARAESAVAAVANAKWVAGTYADGDVRWSPTDYLDYRNKGAGTRNVDPALDPANWSPRVRTSTGGADTTTSAVDITLTASSGRLQIVALTAPNKSMYAPAASTLTKGSSIFVVKNVGTYRFAYRASGGRFVCYIQPGQVVAFHCSDVSTIPGVWHASGQDVDQIYNGNNAEVLNAVASNFIAVAMLTATQAICAFKNNSTTYLDAVVLNYGSASGTPAQVINHDAGYISIAAQTPSQACVVYKKSTGETQAVVLNIISSTAFTPGAVKQIDATTGGIGTAVTALSASQLLALYQGTSAGTPRMRVLDIVSSVVNESAEAVADSAGSHGAFMRAERVSANKALMAHRDNSGKKVQLRLEAISGSTPSATGSGLNLADTQASTTQFGMAVLSASRTVVVTNFGDRSIADFMVSLIDISGTSPVLLRSKVFSLGIGTSAQITATKLDANNIYIAMTGGFSAGVDGATIKITDDDMIVLGKVSENAEPNVGTTAFYAGVAALDSGHVMQVCRNKDTYLSAKTLELAA